MADTPITATKTVEYVNPGIREWSGDDDKTMFFAECAFDDSSSGSVLTFSKAKAEEAQEALRGIKDAPTEFKLVQGKVFNNVQQWKIKGFPGMPEVGGGGGGGSRGGGGMSHAQAGLMAAASALGPTFAVWNEKVPEGGDPVPFALIAADIAELGDLLTDHLFTRRGGQATGDESAGTGSDGQAGTEQTAAPAPASPKDTLSLAQMTKLRQLAKEKGLEVLDVAGKPMGELTPDEAAALIEAWSA